MNRIKKKRFFRKSYERIIVRPESQYKMVKISIREDRQVFLNKCSVSRENRKVFMEEGIIEQRPIPSLYKKYNFHRIIYTPILPVSFVLKYFDPKRIILRTFILDAISEYLDLLKKHMVINLSDIKPILKVNMPLVNKRLNKLRKKRR